MKHEIEAVSDWHRQFGVTSRKIGETPLKDIPVEEKKLRIRLIKEEAIETIELGLNKGDDIETLDGLCDLAFVVAGTVAQLGVDPIPMFNRSAEVMIMNAVQGVEDALAKGDEQGLSFAMMQLGIIYRGIAELKGYPFLQAFNEVHRSNMSKLDDAGKPIKDEGGKIQKGPNYTPPDIQFILNRCGYGKEKSQV